MIIRLICCVSLLAVACVDYSQLRCPEGLKPNPEFVRTYIAAVCASHQCRDKTHERIDAEDAAIRMGYCE